MKLSTVLVFACGLTMGTGAAQALSIPFSGTIDSASLHSGIGTYTPVLDSLSFSGLIATNASNQFSVTLDLPAFTSNGPGCNLPGSGCSPFASNGIFRVTDTGAPFGSHSFSQTGNVVTFSVFDGPEGSIFGSLDLATLTGHVSADVYAGQAFRADNSAGLKAELTISAVPLPGTAPLFGTALLLVSALGYGLRHRTTAAS